MKIPGLTIRKATEMEDWGVCIALYGPPGVGKTTRAADLADSEYGAPLVIVDAEGGTRAISDRSDIDVIDIKSWNDLGRFTSAIRKMSPIPWKTIVFDNLSEYQSLCLRNATQGDLTPQIQHYGQATNEMLGFIRLYRDLARTEHVNIIFIAWEAPEKDEYTGRIKRDVGFTPSLARQFPGIIDIVGYMTARNNPPRYTRVLDFAPSPITAAKMRRSNNEHAKNIPLQIEFSMEQKPLVDIVNTLRGGLPWPTAKYPRQQNIAQQSQTQQSQETEKE